MPGSAMPKKNKEPNLQNSEAKKLLLQDLRSGAIPLDSKSMSPKDAYLKRPEFAGELSKPPTKRTKTDWLHE